MYAAPCWNLLSVHTPMGYIGLSVKEMMGLISHSVLWILIIPYNHGKGSTLDCRFELRAFFLTLVSCSECRLIQAPNFSLRASNWFASIVGGRYR